MIEPNPYLDLIEQEYFKDVNEAFGQYFENEPDYSQMIADEYQASVERVLKNET